VVLNLFCKHSRIKQYLKDGRAMRIETVVNSPRDLGCAPLSPTADAKVSQCLVMRLDAMPLVAVGQPISSRAAAKAVTAAWRSSRVCAAETCVRIRALPTGTTG
jgi:hypothetical protein